MINSMKDNRTTWVKLQWYAKSYTNRWKTWRGLRHGKDLWEAPSHFCCWTWLSLTLENHPGESIKKKKNLSEHNFCFHSPNRLNKHGHSWTTTISRKYSWSLQDDKKWEPWDLICLYGFSVVSAGKQKQSDYSFYAEETTFPIFSPHF